MRDLIDRVRDADEGPGLLVGSRTAPAVCCAQHGVGDDLARTPAARAVIAHRAALFHQRWVVPRERSSISVRCVGREAKWLITGGLCMGGFPDLWPRSTPLGENGQFHGQRSNGHIFAADARRRLMTQQATQAAPATIAEIRAAPEEHHPQPFVQFATRSRSPPVARAISYFNLKPTMLDAEGAVLARGADTGCAEG